MSTTIDLEWLRAELRGPGRSQSELARRLGLHPSAVNKMLGGQREIKLREFIQIEAYLAETKAPEVVEDPSPRAAPLTTRAAELQRLADLVPGRAATWFAMTEAQLSPTVEASLTSMLLKFAKDEHDRAIVALSATTLLDELRRCVVLSLKNLSARDVENLVGPGGYLSDVGLAVLLARGNSIINQAEAKQLKYLWRAYSEDATRIEHEISDEAKASLRRALDFHPSADRTSIRMKLIIFTNEMYGALRATQDRYRTEAMVELEAARSRKVVGEKLIQPEIEQDA